MIRFTNPCLAIVAAMAAVTAAPALAQQEDETGQSAEISEGEQRLAELLEGRVAGEPKTCIRDHMNDRLTVIDKTAYVYGRGRTIYVQRTRQPERIDGDDVLVSRRFGGQLCRLDNITTIDPFGGFFTGVVFFDDFIPYTRVEETDG